MKWFRFEKFYEHKQGGEFMDFKSYILVLMVSVASISNAGNSGGNGGEKVGLHFSQSAQIALRWIQEHDDLSWVQELNQQLKPFTLGESLSASIMNTKIEAVREKLELNEQEKIAINYPEQKLIKVNIELWEASAKADQIAIAAHEHFGVIGVDDRNYRYSTQILRNFTNERTVSDLAVIAGKPNIKVGGIEDIMDQNIILNPELPAAAIETQMYSIFKMQGVTSVANLQVMSRLGRSDLNLLINALHKSAQIAPIVIVPLGPMTHLTCEIMNQYQKTVFIHLLPSSGNGSFLNPPKNCLVDHIIFVSYLNREKTDLADPRNKGEFITVVAPGIDIPVIDEAGHAGKSSGGLPAISLLASALVQYSKKYPALRGPSLANSFLNEETVVLPTLIAKTKNGRAWVKF